MYAISLPCLASPFCVRQKLGGTSSLTVPEDETAPLGTFSEGSTVGNFLLCVLTIALGVEDPRFAVGTKVLVRCPGEPWFDDPNKYHWFKSEFPRTWVEGQVREVKGPQVV